MSNLSEEIINRYLAGQCSEEELIEVNAWMKESEENARQLFRCLLYTSPSPRD